MFSFYYSNTSILSNLSISSLVAVSYVISLYLFFILLSNKVFLSDFNNYSLVTNCFNFKNDFYIGFLFNFSYLNWFVIFFVLSLICLN